MLGMDNQPETEKQVPEVYERLEYISQGLGVLCQHINKLEERLTPVLENRVPKKEDKIEILGSCLLAISLSEQAVTIEGAIQQIKSLLKRLKI